MKRVILLILCYCSCGFAEPTLSALRQLVLEERLGQDPGDLQRHKELIADYLASGKIDQAMRLYFKALALNPQFMDMPSGKKWLESDAWHVGNRALNPEKIWRGEALRGKRILVYCDSLPETIQYSRFLSSLLTFGPHLIFATDPSLKDLLQDSFKAVHVISNHDFYEEYDFHIPLLALPERLHIPRDQLLQGAYLVAAQAPDFKPHFIRSEGKLKVGISGNDALFKLAAPSVDFYALQKIPHKNLTPGTKIVDLSPHIKNPSAMAGCLKNLDLIITTDLRVANLAAALGCKTFLLDEAPLTASLWYKTLTVYSTVSEIQQALSQLAL